MKNKCLLSLLLLATISQGLFSCQSTTGLSSSTAQSATISPQPTIAGQERTHLTSEPGQRAATSRQATATQAEDLQVDASGDHAYVKEGASRVSARAQAKSQRLEKLSPQMKTSLQQAQEIMKTNQADRKAGKTVTREAKKQEKQALRKVLKEARSAEADDQQILEIILAILLAPLGVYLHEGTTNEKFWISLALWVAGIGLFWVIPFIGLLPAIVYALLVVTDTI
jgi:uncharacterized membrane protein YqaE (UPF0057 family)